MGFRTSALGHSRCQPKNLDREGEVSAFDALLSSLPKSWHCESLKPVPEFETVARKAGGGVGSPVDGPCRAAIGPPFTAGDRGHARLRLRPTCATLPPPTPFRAQTRW